MSIGQALREARIRRGYRQEEVAEAGFVTNKSISAIELGRRPLAPGVLPRIARTLNDPRFFIEAAKEATGGVLVGPWLDGDKVDLGRMSVVDKTIEETQEIIEAAGRAKAFLVNARSAKDLGDAGHKAVRRLIHEVFHGVTALQTLAAVLCETFGLSLADEWHEHVAYLEAQGYVKREKPPTKAAR